MTPSRPGDRRLEAAVAARLEAEDRERDHGGDQPGDEQRHAEQQVERDRGADELGQVGGHGDQLGLNPETDRRAPGEVLAAQLGQVPPGGDPDLGRQVLDQHRHQVRRDHDPQQQVAVLGAAGDVGREVARVDVGDRGDESRAEQRQAVAQAPAGAQLLEGAGLGRRGQRLDHDRRSARAARRPRSAGSLGHGPHGMRERAAEDVRAARRTRRSAGPRTARAATTSKRSPGAIPRSAR